MSALAKVLALSRGEAVADLDELALTWSPQARAAALKSRQAHKAVAAVEPEDYRMQHRAPGPDDSDSEYDTTLHHIEQVMPDVHTHPEYYDSEEPHVARETRQQLLAARNKPDHPVKIYRAAPAGVTHIRPGDWVTTSRKYAENHAKHPTDSSKDMPVLSATVPAKHLNGSGDSLHEFGFNGRASIRGKKL